MKNTNKQTIAKTVLTIAAAFLVTALVMLAKNGLSCKLTGTSVGVPMIARQGEIDTLFIGASSFRKGINMKTFQEKYPGETYMLTYNGNQPMNMDVELTELLEANTKIKTLVVEFDPGMIDAHADLSDKRLLWDIGLKSKLYIWNLLSKREDVDFFMMYDYWVSSNIDYMFTYPVAKPMISKRYYRGGNTGDDDVKGLSLEELEAMPIKEAPGFSDLQKASLDNIIDNCAAGNIRLIVLESPNYEKMYTDSNYAEKSALLKDYFTSKGIDVITKDELNFDYTNPSYYSDLSHMSSEGMNVYTDEIIELLKSMQ